MPWKTIAVIEQDGKPKALQQKMSQLDYTKPKDEHRVVPVVELDGVDASQLVDSLHSDVDAVA
jgi:hypothetical protein